MSGKRSWRSDKRKTAERGYGGAWQRSREVFLAQPENVLCVMCKAVGRLTPATVVDHKVPHRGDQKLFWDTSNWQALCATHHSADKQAIERGGKPPRRIGVDGFPIDEGGADPK